MQVSVNSEIDVLQRAEDAVETAFLSFQNAKSLLATSTQTETDAYKKIEIEQQYGNPMSVFIARRNHTAAAELRAAQQKIERKKGLLWILALNAVDRIKHPDRQEDLENGKQILEWLLRCEDTFQDLTNLQQFPLPPPVKCRGCNSREVQRKVPETANPTADQRLQLEGSSRTAVPQLPDYLRIHPTAPARHTNPLRAHPLPPQPSDLHANPSRLASLPPARPPLAPRREEPNTPFCACTIRSAFRHVRDLDKEVERWAPENFMKVRDVKMRRRAVRIAGTICEILEEMVKDRNNTK